MGEGGTFIAHGLQMVPNSTEPAWSRVGFYSAVLACNTPRHCGKCVAHTLTILCAVYTLSISCFVSTHAAVALSGGCDSTALLWLAKNMFSRVTAITVDHK